MKDVLMDRDQVLRWVKKNKPFNDYVIGPLDLRDANLRGGTFQGTVFDHTDLRGADLKGANFSDADLSTAKLKDAVIYRCQLYKASFPSNISAEEINLCVTQGSRIRYNEVTRCLKTLIRMIKNQQK